MNGRAGVFVAVVALAGDLALAACSGAGSNASAGTAGATGSTAHGGAAVAGSTTVAGTGGAATSAGSGGTGNIGPVTSATSSSGASSSEASTSGTSSTGGTGGGSGTGGSPASCGADGGALCYANACPGQVLSLQANRDRLVADLAKRKCTDSCGLWAALNQAERYIFLMDTTYLGAPASRLYPPSYNNLETALDHAVAMYSINGPMAGQGVDGSGRGGNDYNRIYLGFDALAQCVMRNFTIANPGMVAMYNQWVKSDDLAGPHAPFTQRNMIFWYKAWYDLQSNGPQFHFWHQDSDFTQSGLDARLGVCGVTDPSVTELTIAFDFYHNSDPLGLYSNQGGYGWQVVDMYSGITADWSYMPTGCPVTQPVNMDPYGGGTFAGMGPTLVNGMCVSTPLGDAGC